MITRELVIKTASDLFLKNSVKTVTLERIAKELHTSKRTIYIHFEDKTALLRACLQLYFAEVRDENQKMIALAKNPIEAIGYINFQILKRATSANPAFFRDIEAYYPGLLRYAYRENGHFAHTNLTFLAEWGIKDEIFVADMDIEITMKTVQALLELTKDTNIFPIGEYSKKRLTFGIMLPYLRGVCTEKGIKILEKQKDLFGISI
jgi:TetR/AcrR family transcriptional regulator, cholesterol catabolism regulator